MARAKKKSWEFFYDATWQQPASSGHNSWDKAYDSADLYDWLLRHRFKKKP